jgi:tRNA A37 threonylcarbamoyladenosine dehydratase
MPSCDLEQRFGGIARLYGSAGLAVLRELHVCVVGVGGVGSWAVEALARSGVGRITCIDHDSVCETNTNRQIHALSEHLGRSKIAVMAERVAQINPECVCDPIDDYLTLQTLDDYLGRGYDYVIDAIDSIKFKSAMIAHCQRTGVPIVTTGGAGGQDDPTLVTVADLSRTFNDPLASKVRSTLRRDYGFPRDPGKRFGIDCVFSTQQPVYPQADGSVSQRKPGIHGVSLDCRFGYGAASFVTATFGFVAVSRVINVTLKRRPAVAAGEVSPRV